MRGALTVSRADFEELADLVNIASEALIGIEDAANAAGRAPHIDAARPALRDALVLMRAIYELGATIPVAKERTAR